MRWIKVSERFPDDWESKILRTVVTKIVLDNNEWIHINDNFWNSGKRIDFQYDQIEWLDELELDQDELWEELKQKLAFYRDVKIEELYTIVRN